MQGRSYLSLTLVARCLTADAVPSSSSLDSHGISEPPPPASISKLVLYFLAPFEGYQSPHSLSTAVPALSPSQPRSQMSGALRGAA